MPQPLNAVVVLIASPGDTGDERAAVRDVLIDWNMDSGRRQQVVAMPWLYERHAVPEMGDRPQAIINAQAVDQADVVVAIFDSRLGTHTGVDVSGTAEEINRAIDLGKPVHIYFSNEDLPRTTDPDQLSAMRDFQSELQTRGLLGEYTDPRDLAGQVRNALQHDIEKHGWSEQSPTVSRASGARLMWRHDHVKEQKGLDRKNQMTYRTKTNQLVVRNDGEAAAEDLEFEVTELGEMVVRLDKPEHPVRLHPQSELSWLCIPIRSGTISIYAKWSEGGHPQEMTRTVTVRG